MRNCRPGARALGPIANVEDCGAGAQSALSYTHPGSSTASAHVVEKKAKRSDPLPRFAFSMFHPEDAAENINAHVCGTMQLKSRKYVSSYKNSPIGQRA